MTDHSDLPDSAPGRGCGRGPGARRRRRLFDYGDLRLLALLMIEERPRHGYELIKQITARFDGAYSPSPGVMYPTLAWLEDMGYVTIRPDASGRKRSEITPQGQAFLQANRAAAEELLTRRPPRDGVPPEVEAGMDAVKAALRRRLGRAPRAAEIKDIADELHAAATRIAGATGPGDDTDS